MEIMRVRPVKIPERGTNFSSGIDFFIPEFNKTFIKDLYDKNEDAFEKNNLKIDVSKKVLVMMPHSRVLIPSGVKVNLAKVKKEYIYTLLKMFGDTKSIDSIEINPEFYHLNKKLGIALTAHNKSGVGSKKGLDKLAELVDEDYQGEIHISLVNTGDEEQYIWENDKIIQFVVELGLYEDIKDVPIDIGIFNEKTDRGDGGFGSTDKKKK